MHGQCSHYDNTSVGKYADRQGDRHADRQTDGLVGRQSGNGVVNIIITIILKELKCL